jgi:hypothetical protein
VISNILSQFLPVTKIVPVFGLYAIPFKTSAVFFDHFLRPERSIIPSTAHLQGFTTAIASFCQIYIEFALIYSSSLIDFILVLPE